MRDPPDYCLHTHNAQSTGERRCAPAGAWWTEAPIVGPKERQAPRAFGTFCIIPERNVLSVAEQVGLLRSVGYPCRVARC